MRLWKLRWRSISSTCTARQMWKPPAMWISIKPLLIYSSYLSLVVATGFTLYSGYSFLTSNKSKLLS